MSDAQEPLAQVSHPLADPPGRVERAPGAAWSADAAGSEAMPRSAGLGESTREPLQAGQRIRPYSLVRPLGVGGMAEIWLARRADGAFRRELALKIPFLTRRREELLERFRRERDILASLEHPHIARFYDAGLSADGLPYMAMEFVDGVTVTRWCEQHALAARARIELLLQALDAVNYAHRRRVLHCDLKPSNILVTESGHVLLLDFGIARLLGADAVPDPTVRAAPLTPGYASPEQWRGEAPGVANDIFSLGLVLAELLIEHPVERRPGAETAARSLRGDLGAMVAKALDPEAARRYATVEEFSDDLVRFLNGEPVLARPLRGNQRVADRLRQHAGHLALAIFSAACIGSGIAMIVGNGGARWPAATVDGPGRSLLRLPPDLDSLASAQPRSIAVLPFEDLSQGRDQGGLADALARQLADQLERNARGGVAVRASYFPYREAHEDVRSLAARIGASHVLEGSIRRTGDTLRVSATLVRAGDGALVWTRTYERTMAEGGNAGDAIAQAIVAAVLGGAQDSAASPPLVDADVNQQAFEIVLRGRYLLRRGTREDTQAALAAFGQAIELNPRSALAWSALASGYEAMGLGGWMPARAVRADASSALRHALAIEPRSAALHAQLAGIELGFGYDFARSALEAALARTLDPHSDLPMRRDVIDALAHGKANRAAGLARRLADADPLNVELQLFLASVLLDDGQLDAAESVTRETIAINPHASGAHRRLCQILLARGRPEEALALVTREAEEGERLAGLADAYWALDRRSEANAMLGLLKSRHGDAMSYAAATSYALRGDTDNALWWLDRALRNFEPRALQVRSDPAFRHVRDSGRLDQILASTSLN